MPPSFRVLLWVLLAQFAQTESVSAILTEKLARKAEHPNLCDTFDPLNRRPLVDIAVIDLWHK